MTISNDVERWLQRESPTNLLAISWILGALILFCASFFNVEDYTVPVYDTAGIQIYKQYGLWWAGLNWVVEFLVILPALLFMLSHMSSTVRIAVGRLIDISRTVGGDKSVELLSQTSLDDRIAKFRYAFLALLVALMVAIFKIWLSACGYNLLSRSVGSDLIFWGNGAVVDKYTNLNYIFIYSTFVYFWLFIIVFSYLFSLIITIIYSIHIGSLLSNPGMSIPGQGGSEKPYLGQVANILKSFTFQTSFIYMLGLTTTFVLNLQLAYLESSYRTMSEFLLEYANVYSKIQSFSISRMLISTPSIKGLSNDEIWFPSLLLFTFTILALVASGYHLWVGLNDFNQKFSKNTPIKFANIYYGFSVNLTLAVMLSVCSFFPNLGLVVVSAILGRLVVFIVNKARKYNPMR